MKNIILRILGEDRVRNIKYDVKYILGSIYKNRFKDLKDKKKIFYMLVPIHGNLGDQAIAYASRKFLQDKFDEYEIIEINCIDTYKYSKAVKNVIKM